MESTQSPIIDKAKPEDAQAIRDIEAITWLATYPNNELGISVGSIRKRIEGVEGERITQRIEKWHSIIASSGPGTGQTYVARLGGLVVGFGSSHINKDSMRTVGAMYVLPEAQDRGVGKELMQKVLDWLGNDEDIYVTVASYNQKAINFYKSYGFQPTDKVASDTPAPDTLDLEKGDIEIPDIKMVLPAQH